jgi:hypothetical protein
MVTMTDQNKISSESGRRLSRMNSLSYLNILLNLVEITGVMQLSRMNNL